MSINKNLVLIVGAMKAGTTSLFDHLTQHPEVAGCTPKEPGFFAFDDVFARGADWYEGLFDFDARIHKVALDGSTDYTKWPHCDKILDRIAAFGADPKLIYLMRHPLRRLESHAKHVQFAKCELGRRPSPIADHSLDAGVSAVSLDVSRYAQQLDQYHAKIENGQMLIVTLEELSTNPQQCLSDIYRYLEIDPRLGAEKFETSNKGATLRRGNAIHPLWRAAKNIQPLYAAVKYIVPQHMRDAWRVSTRPKIAVAGRFKFTAQEEAEILERLSPDLVRLRDHYGIDIERIWGICPDHALAVSKASA